VWLARGFGLGLSHSPWSYIQYHMTLGHTVGMCTDLDLDFGSNGYTTNARHLSIIYSPLETEPVLHLRVVT
jgi:hypothetical protein